MSQTRASQSEDGKATTSTNNLDVVTAAGHLNLEILPLSAHYVQEQFNELHRVKNSPGKVPVQI